MIDLRTLFQDPDRRPARYRAFLRLARHLDRALQKSGRLELAARFVLAEEAGACRETGIAPIDAARAARRHGCDPEILRAIRHMSGSFHVLKVTRPDMAEELGPKCSHERSTLSRALTFCDLRTGPDGAPVPVEAKIAASLPGALPEDARSLVNDEFRKIDAEFAAFLDADLGPDIPA